MSLIYFAVLAVVVAVAYLWGRARAQGAASGASLHSRPTYHGAFVALAVLLPMVASFAVGVPVASWIVEAQSLSGLDPTLVGNDLQRSAALRDIHTIVAGTYSGTPTPELKRAADTYASLRSLMDVLVFGGGM